jgi:hypothetical protein
MEKRKVFDENKQVIIVVLLADGTDKFLTKTCGNDIILTKKKAEKSIINKGECIDRKISFL